RRFHSPFAFHSLCSPPPRRGKGLTALRRRRRARARVGGTGGRSKTPLLLEEGITPTAAIRNLVIRCLPFGNVDWDIVTKQQIAGVEKIFALVRGQGKNTRIHADSIARAGFDTEAAEHTAQFINDERGGVFLYRGIRVFTSLNMNAQGWARRGTEHTIVAAWRAIFFVHQSMAPAIVLLVVCGLFRLLLRDRMASPKYVRHKMAVGHCHPPQNFRDIQFLPECQRLHSQLTFMSDRTSK